MASILFNSYIDDLLRGLIPAAATYKMILTTSAYTENKDTHLVRSDVTGEVAAGNGYTAGGATVTVSITKDLTNDRVDISLGGATFTTAAGQTLTARKAVYYVNVGTAGTDRLVGVNDFTTDQIATNGGPLTVQASIARFQNS